MAALNSSDRVLGHDALRLAGREFGDLFDRLFEVSPIAQGRNGSPGGPWMPPASVWEDDQRFHVQIDLPGVATDSLEVTMDEKHLSVRASRSFDDEGRKYLHHERRGGEVTRALRLPETIDRDSIEADYQDGVLHVTVAKRPEVLPRKIEVRTGSGEK